jgi:hypothetical protein
VSGVFFPSEYCSIELDDHEFELDNDHLQLCLTKDTASLLYEIFTNAHSGGMFLDITQA